MANYLPLPDGRYFELPEGVTDSRQAISLAMQRFPELYQLSTPEAAAAEPETGFVAGVKSGFENLKGDIGAIGAGLGIEGGAEYSTAQREKAGQIFKQAEFSEDPIDYVTGLLGQSVAYMAAPVVAAGLASTAPVSGALGLGATAAGLLGAGAASATQFTGSNLSRQLEEGTAPEDLQLGAAVAAAIPQAALDTAALRFLPGVNKLLGKFGREATKEEALAAARKLAEASAAGLVKSGGVQVAKNAGIEGLTEAGQQVFERMQAGLDMMDEQARGEYLDNFIGGATLGGLFGAGSRIGAQGRAKNTVATEDRRVADEATAAEQARLDQLSLLEGGTETRAVPYVEASTQAQSTLPGMEAVEPQASQEAAPPEGSQLMEQRQYLERVIEDNQQQMSDAVAAQDMDAYKKLRDQRGVMTSELGTVNAQLKASGFQDTASQQVQLQTQLAKAQESLSKMAGDGFDPAKADKLVDRIDALQKQLGDVGGAQSTMLGKDVPMLDLAARRREDDKLLGKQMGAGREDSARTRAVIDAETAALQRFGQESETPGASTVEAERLSFGATKAITDLFDAGATDTVPVSETVTPMPRQQFKVANNQYNTLLNQVDKLSNSMVASNREKADDIRDQINDIREKSDGYLKQVFDARAEQDVALNEFTGALTDIRAGLYRQGTKGTLFNDTLANVQSNANEARAKYIKAALREAATHRRAEGRPALTRDEALKAADEMDGVLNAALEEISTRSTADRSGAYKETRIVAPAQMRSGQIIKPAVLKTRDSRPLAERPFGAPRAAQEVIIDSLSALPKIRDGLFGKRQAQVEKPLLRTQFAETEAQKTAAAKGETATTLRGELARRTEFVRNKMAKMAGMRPAARDVLNKAADVMDAGKASRELLDSVESVVDDILVQRQPRMSDLRAINDTLKAKQPTATEQREAGQKSLFDNTTERRREDNELGVIRKNFKALMASPAVRSGQAAVAKAKEDIAKLEKQQAAAEKTSNLNKKENVLEVFKKVEDQRAALQQAMDGARAAEGKIQLRRRAIFGPIIEATNKRLAAAKAGIQKAADQADQEGIAPDIRKRVDSLLDEINTQEKTIATLQAQYIGSVDNAARVAASYRNLDVQFEQKLLDRFTKDLDKARKAANTPPAAIKQLADEAKAQRTRVAQAEFAERTAKETASRLRRELEQRMLKFRQAGSTAKQTELSADAATQAKKEEVARLQKILNSVDDMVDARKAAQGKRATGPVARTQSAAPSTFRSGTAESKSGTNTVLRDQRTSQAKGTKTRDVPIKKSEMLAPATMTPEEFGKLSLAEQNAILAKREAAETARIAEEIKNKTPAQKRKDAQEAAALAKELDKALLKGREDGDFYDGLGDNAYLRESSEAYDAPSFTPVKINVNKALRSGDAVKAAELLAESGSTPFVRKLSGLLSTLLGNAKVEVVSDLYVDGKRAAGSYESNKAVMQFDEEAVSEEVILHEMIHAVTLRVLKAPIDTLTDAQKAARVELESMFAAVKKNTNLAREYGITNIAEFASEMMSNRVLQNKLANVKWTGGGNMFTRFINKVLAFLGLKEGVDFNKQATQNILNLFEKAMPMTEGRQIDNVASVLRGVFPNTEPKFATGISKEAQAAAGRQVARTPGFMASLFSPAAAAPESSKTNRALAWRTQLLDRFAPIEELLRKGVERGVIPDMQLFQTLYYMRFGEQVNQYVAQAASNGVVRRVKAADGTYTFEAVEGDNIARIAETLRDAGIGNEQAAEEMFTTWMAGLRAGQGQIGWDKLNFKDAKQAKADWDAVNKDVQNNPKIKDAFESARKQYRQYNKDLLTFLSDSGAMSRDEAVRLSALDYVPFYRKNGEEVELMIDREKIVKIGNLKNQPYLKELIGGEDSILPFFESALQNTRMILDMGMRNIQTKDVAYVLQKMNGAEIRKGSGPAGTNIVRFREGGEMKHAVIGNWEKNPTTGKLEMTSDLMYGVPADLLVKGLEGIKTTIPAVVRLMSYPANLLRKTVTIMPTYALRQAIRDPLNAWMVTGGNFTPIASSFKELAKMVGGKSETQSILQQAGAISSNVFTGDKQDITRILRDTVGGKAGWQKLVAKAEGFAIQGDSSTRAVLYNMYREKGMTHMQALLGSLESMNFSRRGVSPSMQFMSMMVPFFNAQIQGLDVLWRAGKGKSLFQKEMDVQALMLKRGFMMAAGTIAYAALMQDDESYKNATPEQRALNWFIPLPGVEASLRIPIPFELGYAFKSIPEMVINVAFGDQKAGDAMKALGALAYQTVPIGMPQGMKPIVEVATNYSFFTGSPVESNRMQGLIKSERYSPNTTELAKMLSAATFSTVSPMQVEHLIRGYTGSLGITLLQIPNVALRPLTDQAERPTKLINEYPVIGTLFQPADGRGVVNAAYDRLEEFQQAKRTYNTMIAEGRGADAKAFAQKYSTEIALNSLGGSFRQQMGELAKLKRGIAASKTLTPDQKRDRVQEIKRLEIRMSRRISELD